MKGRIKSEYLSNDYEYVQEIINKLEDKKKLSNQEEFTLQSFLEPYKGKIEPDVYDELERILTFGSNHQSIDQVIKEIQLVILEPQPLSQVKNYSNEIKDWLIKQQNLIATVGTIAFILFLCYKAIHYIYEPRIITEEDKVNRKMYNKDRNYFALDRLKFSDYHKIMKLLQINNDKEIVFNGTTLSIIKEYIPGHRGGREKRLLQISQGGSLYTISLEDSGLGDNQCFAKIEKFTTKSIYLEPDTEKAFHEMYNKIMQSALDVYNYHTTDEK